MTLVVHLVGDIAYLAIQHEPQHPNPFVKQVAFEVTGPDEDEKKLREQAQKEARSRGIRKVINLDPDVTVN